MMTQGSELFVYLRGLQAYLKQMKNQNNEALLILQNQQDDWEFTQDEFDKKMLKKYMEH